MLAIYASTLVILLASLLLGRAILAVLGWPRPAYLSGAVGFATLVAIAPFVVRLPGRATTAAVLLGALLVAAAITVARVAEPKTGPPRPVWAVPLAVTLMVIAAASTPFLFQDHTGILGEGIYTNDHAAQLYWSEWLQSGFGREPSAVRFGYPIGPQALTVVAAEVTGTDLVSAFNGLLLAIPALTALAALGALGDLPPVRRTLVAGLCALPYLAASFLAQSAFKETAMALFVLALAVALSALAAQRASIRAVAVVVLLLAAGSVFTYSIPGLAWFALAIPVWLGLEELAGRSQIDLGRARAVLVRHRVALTAGAVALAAVIAVSFGPAREFVERIDDVQQSAGRLSSPVFPGEALGIWPEGDFRIVRGEVAGALPAVALAALAIAVGGFALLRRRELALPAVLATGGVVYVGARYFAEIHVEAKALAVIAPLAALVTLRGLFVPGSLARYTLGGLTALALAGSTFLALRAAPVGFDHRGEGLEALGERIDGSSVVFLGVDRFSGYRLRGTLARAPAGFVPEEIAGRPEKAWQQGEAADFDTVKPAKLDKFDYAITTAAAYQSSPPRNFEPIGQSAGYVLWRREGETVRSRVLPGEGGDPGEPLECAGTQGERLTQRSGAALVLERPTLGSFEAWRGTERVEDATGGQERAFAAPGVAEQTLRLEPGREYTLSLQYHSQAPLTVTAPGLEQELPPALDGMYLDGAGRGAYWPVGRIAVEEVAGRPREVTVRVEAEGPDGLADALGVEHRVWLGNLAATPVAEPEAAPIQDACGDYVDRFSLERRGGDDRAAPESGRESGR
ncbi:MAG: hypothetical protein ACRDK9_11285 [Solirubrobacterales bacterium]